MATLRDVELFAWRVGGRVIPDHTIRQDYVAYRVLAPEGFCWRDGGESVRVLFPAGDDAARGRAFGKAIERMACGLTRADAFVDLFGVAG
jgi:hypothetical protein